MLGVGKVYGVVGATGAVGMEMVSALFARGFRPAGVRLFASARSAGRHLETPFGTLPVEVYDTETVRAACDVVFLAVSGGFSKAFAPALAEGAVVIDNSSAWRNDPEIPLVVPEINPGAARGARLVANPNCTTAIAAVALWPLHQRFGLKKVLVSTYQAASGAGAPGMAELEAGLRAWAGGEALEASVFAHPLPFNVIPHIDSFQENGYTREEMKVVWETRKIFGEPDLAVSCTAVRVPTLRAHAEAITVETRAPATPEAARQALEAAPGVEVCDDPGAARYPMPLHAAGRFAVEVGRIRQSLVFGEHGLEFFVCGDQLLKGAALNAVQIAELL